MIRRSVLALLAVAAMVMGCVVVASPAGAAIDTAVVVPSPNSGARSNVLKSVSCVSTTSCVAVGYYVGASAYQSLVLNWDGTSWTRVDSPNSGSNANVLNSVSCVTASSCVAVGWYVADSGIETQSLVLTWDGSSWAKLDSPNPSAGNNFLNSVSCVTTISCVAVGTYDDVQVSTSRSFVVNWDGTSWTKAESPNTGIYDNVLNSVSCVSGSSCVAAGYYVDGSGTQLLVLNWDGTSWTKLDSPNPGSDSNVLSSVSCVTESSCVAVGNYSNSVYQSFVLNWDGISWTKLDSPNIPPFNNVVSSVSCATGFSCLAVGKYGTGNGSVDQTLALLLTGPEPPVTTTTSSTTSSDPVAPAFTG